MLNADFLNSASTDSVSARAAGYRWVAEWHSHDATWIAWPHNQKTWPGRFEPVPRAFERMVRTLAEVEEVHVLGGPTAAFDHAYHSLSNCRNVTLHRVTTDDCWIRDFGPTFVLGPNHELGAIDWRFNNWGMKYEPYENDASNALRISNMIGCRRFSSSLTCEGGGLETDGEGTLMTTSSCLLSAARNPGWPRAKIEETLCEALSLDKILWVDGGALEGDDTDSHIDQLARFVRPGVIVAARSRDVDDSNYLKLEKQWQLLQTMQDARDRNLEIIPLFTPPPRYIDSRRVPESYCNFYIANEIVLVPTFGYRESDEAAMKVLGECMPGRTMIPIDASDLVFGLGAIHCATQQQPNPLSAT